MRHALVLLVALALAGGSSALPLVRPDPVADAIARSDALAAQLARIDGPAGAIDAGIAIWGVAPADVTGVASPSLEQAIIRLYAASDVPVDAALAAEVHRQAGALDAPALLALVDAVADAQLASRGILSDADRALLFGDLATTMKLVTFGEERSEWRAPRQERLDALARADLALAAGAAARLADALPSVSSLAPVEDCDRAIDLPFIQVGAPCDDVYAAETLNFIQIDYGGNDQYYNNAGAGIAGVGVGLSIDEGAGDDIYSAPASAQGAATGGVGILIDEGGADSYFLSQFGQGFGVAGVGLLYDAGPESDTYTSGHASDSIGTKAGGLGGVGILVDEGGNEIYQQDGLDGFVYGAAGGLGLLVDQGAGNDQYVTADLPIVLLDEFLGEFAGPVQVSAEVHATAILYEEGGNDLYTCGAHVRQGCQGAGGVGALALLYDISGDDEYRLGESVSPTLADVSGLPEAGILPIFPSGQGVAYGEGSAPPGPGAGILRDLAGDDRYLAGPWAQGYATGGLGLLLDEAGTDAYSGAPALSGSRGDGQTWLDGLALGVGMDEG